VAEGARLESVYTRKCIEGSNPSLTAKFKKKAWIRVQAFFFAWCTAERGEHLSPSATVIPISAGYPRTLPLIFSPIHDICPAVRRSFQQSAHGLSGRTKTQKLFLTGSAPLPIVAPRCSDDFATKKYGEVSEWLKEHAWKVCIRESVSRVRIPPSPPYSNEKA
jgi:hypothetical protein